MARFLPSVRRQSTLTTDETVATVSNMTSTEATTDAAQSAAITKHIRLRGKMRADRRFTVQSGRGPRSRMNVNHHGTICGADPTGDDFDRDGAAHAIKCAQIPQLAHWTAGMCEICKAGLS